MIRKFLPAFTAFALLTLSRPTVTQAQFLSANVLVQALNRLPMVAQVVNATPMQSTPDLSARQNPALTQATSIPGPAANGALMSLVATGAQNLFLDHLQVAPAPFVPLGTANRTPDPLLQDLFGDVQRGSTLAVSDASTLAFPIEETDPDTGLSVTIDAQMHFTLNDSAGDTLREFDIFANYLGEPVAEYMLDDGTINRESLDGFTAAISADGETWTLSDGVDAFDLERDADGALTYTDEEGNTFAFYDEGEGSLSASTEDGSLLVLDPLGAGEFLYYDAEGELLETFAFENPDAEDRAAELEAAFDEESLLDVLDAETSSITDDTASDESDQPSSDAGAGESDAGGGETSDGG